MKPQATVDSKTDTSMTDMAPVQIFQQKEDGEKRGLTGKHVLIAVTTVIAVAIVVSGFVAGFYMLKQTSEKHAESMTKVFHMKVSDGKQTINENIQTNVDEKTTEIDTTDEDGNKKSIYNDFKKGLSVVVASDCYVSPLNRSSMEDPVALQNYMESHPDLNVNSSSTEKEITYMTQADDPIEDTAFLGTKINRMCAGKKIYWMYPQNPETEVAKRKKRAILCMHCKTLYCWTSIIGGIRRRRCRVLWHIYNCRFPNHGHIGWWPCRFTG